MSPYLPVSDPLREALDLDLQMTEDGLPDDLWVRMIDATIQLAGIAALSHGTPPFQVAANIAGRDRTLRTGVYCDEQGRPYFSAIVEFTDGNEPSQHVTEVDLAGQDISQFGYEMRPRELGDDFRCCPDHGGPVGPGEYRAAVRSRA